MQRTARHNSLKHLSFEIHYLNNPNDIEHLGNVNYEDIIYVRCYPKWKMQEQMLKKLVEDNKPLLFKKMEEVSILNDTFYCYFDIDFTAIKGTTSKIIDNKVCWIEVRPVIKKKNIDDPSSGFINAGELPPEN